MRRGLGTLEILILMGVVTAIIAALAASLRPKLPVNTQPVIVELSTSYLYSLNASSACEQIVQNLTEAKVIDYDKPITFGNSSDPYVVVEVIYSSSDGMVKGVQVVSKLNNSLITVYSETKLIPQGRSLVCVFSDKPLSGMEVKFVGVNNICLDCST